MQAIFRLPWCTEQLKLSEKAGLDKMRPSPVLDIPMLNQLKRKRSDTSEAPSMRQQLSPKRQRPEGEHPQQLPTPSSPYASAQPSCIADPVQTSVHSKLTPSPKCEGVATLEPVEQAAAATAGDKNVSLDGDGTIARRIAGNPSGDIDHSVQHPTTSADMLATQQAPLTSRLTNLQQVIENEFNMQILMKHNELRLIEQELGKCQIALEQLRRCEVRPFPGSSQPDSGVSKGSGFAVNPPPGFSRASHAAPYGVTDGPYSRHYRQWLLHDPQFESLPPQALAQADYPVHPSSRSTRGVGHVRKPASKSLGSSTRASDSLQSIPNYPAPATKDKSAPLVLKRSTDNQLVKLICKDCKRGNFSSIQGFLNHCRIAHKVDYKSHDAAAIDCGQLLDEGELANVPAETQAAPAPRPSHSRASSAVVHGHRTSGSSLVHPMNTTACVPAATPRTAPRTPVAPVPGLSSGLSNSNDTPFKGSAQVPRLSAHFAKHGLGGDLEQAAAAARQRIDLGVDEEIHSPNTPDSGSPVAAFSGATRVPSGAPNAGAFPAPPSRKGFRQPSQRPRPSPLAPAPPNMAFHSSNLSSPQDLNSATLSPHADSNPGLVSDHEDDDHASASDGEHSAIDVAPAPRLPVGRSCEDQMDIDVQEDDEIDQHGVIIRRNSMVANDARAMRPAGGPSRNLGGK